MFAETTQFRATLVAATANPYDFTDKVTGRQVSGTSYRLWLVRQFSEAPVSVKCSERQYIDAQELPGYCALDVTANITANNNRLGYELVTMALVSSNGAKTRTAGAAS